MDRLMRSRFATYLPLRFIAALCIIFSFWLPLGIYDGDAIFWRSFPQALATMLIGLGGLAVAPWAILRLVALGIAAAALIMVPALEVELGLSASGFWLALIGFMLFAWSMRSDFAAITQMGARR